MNAEETQSALRKPYKPYKPHPRHHFITGILVFLLGVGVNEVLNYSRASKPKRVLWSNGEMQTNFHAEAFSKVAGVRQFEVGVSEDGLVVWRPK